MTKNYTPFLLIGIILLFACDRNPRQMTFQNSMISETPEVSATYLVTITGQWTKDNFPDHYPAHPAFSNFVGMTHPSTVQLYRMQKETPNGLSEFIVNNDAKKLQRHIKSLINAGNAGELIYSPALDSGNASVSFNLTVDETNSLVSVLGSISPSPDWFVGLRNISLLKDGYFVSNLTLNMNSYDAGLNGGQSFGDDEMEMREKGHIVPLSGFPFSASDEQTPVLAKITFTKK
ncbi:spondin domain-containing protein [Persicobacter psychrovividus]|uniref:Spondin domain-containing protein n=1 Tax=Persicobacter psychrovividus TaxID=387638 RepID=A0ABM7VJ60_9BACT|nr:hypothetical protein PEPS_32970 [Persicobacter psychrovividus]